MFQSSDPINPLAPNGTDNLAKELDPSSFWDSFKGLSFDQFIEKLANDIISFSIKVMIAIVVFYLGRFIIRKIYKWIFNMMTRRKVDPSLTTFTLSLVKIILYFILVVTIVGILGIETSSFIAIFASAGVAIGMALSGTLQNFAGGVLILLLKPYRVGDYIETQGYAGTVKSIQLFNTFINTIDNKTVIIPNGVLSTTSINNYSSEQYRRVDWSVSLSYGTDAAAAKKAIMDILMSDPQRRVVKRFIEDDMAYREQVREEKLAEEKLAEIEEEEHQKSWLYRLFHHKKEKMVAKLNPSSPIDMPVAIPKQVDRSPFVGLGEMADSAIVFTVRAWTYSANYWPLYYEMNERFYTELQQRGFSFPFPQMDVHVDGSIQS